MGVDAGGLPQERRYQAFSVEVDPYNAWTEAHAEAFWMRHLGGLCAFSVAGWFHVGQGKLRDLRKVEALSYPGVGVELRPVYPVLAAIVRVVA